MGRVEFGRFWMSTVCLGARVVCCCALSVYVKYRQVVNPVRVLARKELCLCLSDGGSGGSKCR